MDWKAKLFHIIFIIFMIWFSIFLFNKAGSSALIFLTLIIAPYLNMVCFPDEGQQKRYDKEKARREEYRQEIEDVLYKTFSGFDSAYKKFDRLIEKYPEFSEETEKRRNRVIDMEEEQCAAEKQEQKQRLAAFVQDLNTSEWLANKFSFEKAKILLESLLETYPEYSTEIDKRKKRVMESQTKHFKEKIEDKLSKVSRFFDE